MGLVLESAMKASVESVMKASLESAMAGTGPTTDQGRLQDSRVQAWPPQEVGWPVAAEHWERVSGAGAVRV